MSFFFSDIKPCLFLRVKALWADRQHRKEFSSPQWGLWRDKAAITHTVVGIMGADAMSNGFGKVSTDLTQCV